MDAKPFPDPSRAFYLGLNMSGAISAGAYTAGVMDFLIEALDAWSAERARQKTAFGGDFDQWTVPAHAVSLAVMAGASAGGMVSAIAAAALCQDIEPVRAIPKQEPANPLYQSWVAGIDASHLLGNEDLSAPGASVQSILDSSVIDRIASDAVRIVRPLAARRSWVHPGLKVALTLTNLGGIPYAIEEGSSAETQTLNHADRRRFEVRWDGVFTPGDCVPLSPESSQNWDQLAAAAKATGAFPLMLKPREIERAAGEYNHRRWAVSTDQPNAGGDCQCFAYDPMPPNWTAADNASFTTLNVDGGVTDNDPFACAHDELMLLDPPCDNGHAPRSSLEADRAVINVAPFLSAPTYQFGAKPDAGLLPAFGALISTLVNQSRIQGENIRLTRDPGTFTRYAIAPSIDDATVSALASATLGAFGGFIARAFRDHDFQLGRRNCQRFLQLHFALPLDNVVMRDTAPSSAAARARLLDEFGADLKDGSRGVQIVPLVGRLRDEVTSDRGSAAIDRALLPPLADAAVDRLKRVASSLLSDHGAGWAQRSALDTLWLFARNPLRDKLLFILAKQLAMQKLVN